jgi:hypothetical protein
MGHVMLKYTVYSNVMCTTGYSKLPKTNISMLAICKLFFLEKTVFHLQIKLVKLNVTIQFYSVQTMLPHTEHYPVLGMCLSSSVKNTKTEIQTFEERSLLRNSLFSFKFI